MPSIQVRDIEMYYREYGPDEGEPLVLLHGFTATGRSFDTLIDRLDDKYRLYVPDWRGHGRTTNPKDEIRHQELARDTAAFAEALGLEQAHFCGQSSGGMHLTFLALEHPDLVHTLTYSASTYFYDEHLKSMVREITAAVPSEWVERLEEVHGPTHGEGYGWTIVQHWSDAVNRPGELPFTQQDLGRISCPTLIVHGDRDRFFPVQVPVSTYEAIPHAELCILPQCGHDIPAEQPEMLAAALLQFLARHPMMPS